MPDLDPDTITTILDAAEKRLVEQVRRDIELMGRLDESDLTTRVKSAPAAIRGTLAFSLAGMGGLRRNWAEAGRTGIGEAYAQMVLRSIACCLSTEDLAELVGIGRVLGESEALLLITGADRG